MSPQTYTYTWTQTRLETIQDQFRYLLTYADVSDEDIDQIVKAVGKKVLQAVGIYGCDGSGLRVIEVELRVDWALNAELTLKVPIIASGLSGWDGKQAPEVKVLGRRFANAVNDLRLSTNLWVTFVPEIISDPPRHAKWKRKLNVGGTIPGWKNMRQKPPPEKHERLLDVEEASIYIRRAGN